MKNKKYISPQFTELTMFAGSGVIMVSPGKLPQFGGDSPGGGGL